MRKRSNTFYQRNIQPMFVTLTTCANVATYSTSSARTRRGGSCLKDIYKTFLIYRICMRRAPAKPVRACTLRNWCLVSHVTFEAPLHTALSALYTPHTSHCTLRTPHFTLHTAHFTVHTSHCTRRTPNKTLHFTFHSPHFTLLTSHCFLHTPNFTLHTALFTPHTSSNLSCSHLIPAQLCHASFHESLPSTTSSTAQGGGGSFRIGNL